MSLRDLLIDLRTWWWRRERASQLIRDMADLGPGQSLVLTDNDRFALVERLVVLRDQLDDAAADSGPVPTTASPSAFRRRPALLAEAIELANRQAEGCALMQRVIEASGSVELSADECSRVVAYWRWLEVNRRGRDD